MAYMTISISGNEDFIPYISVDGAESYGVQDGYVYELEDGPHFFQVHSTTDAQRKAGQRQRAVNNLIGSGAMGVFSDIQSTNAIGQTWEFHAEAYEGQRLSIHILADGNSIRTAPRFSVEELTEEELEEYEGIFEKIHAEQEAERQKEEERRLEREKKEAEERERRATTPRISLGLMIPGIVITAVCSMCALSTTTMFLGEETIDPSAYVVWGILGAGIITGLCLLFSGLKKKIRP